MKPILLTILVIKLQVVHAQSIYDSYAQQTTAETDSVAAFHSIVTQQFAQINDARLRQKDFTPLLAAGETIPALINNWKHTIMSIKDTLDFNTLTIVKSEDKNFCIVSWDTRLGDTKTDYASMLLYRCNDSIYVTSNRQEFIKNTPENPKIRYTAIYTLKTKDNIVYLAKGYGQGTTTEPWQEIKTFCIERGLLSTPAILPGRQHRILVAINVTQLKGAKKIPALLYNSTDHLLTIPETDKKHVFTGTYSTFLFTNNAFKAVKDKEIKYAIVPY